LGQDASRSRLTTSAGRVGSGCAYGREVRVSQQLRGREQVMATRLYQAAPAQCRVWCAVALIPGTAVTARVASMPSMTDP
jgi:hypothetical protein